MVVHICGKYKQVVDGYNEKYVDATIEYPINECFEASESDAEPHGNNQIFQLAILRIK